MTFRDPTLLERLGCGQQGVGASPHARTSSGEVHPAHHSRGIYQELCRPGDILSVRSSTRMQQMIAPYQLGVGIGENRKSVTSLPTEITRDLWSVHPHHKDQRQYGEYDAEPGQRFLSRGAEEQHRVA